MLRIALLLVSIVFSTLASAEQKKTFDGPDGSEYDVHYIAFNSTFLEPDIAKQYGLIRSKSLGVVNVSIIQKYADGTSKAVTALVQGRVTNEIQQQQILAFQQVIEGPAIYYLAQTQFSEGKRVKIDLELYPAGVQEPLVHRFSHAFFND